MQTSRVSTCLVADCSTAIGLPSLPRCHHTWGPKRFDSIGGSCNGSYCVVSFKMLSTALQQPPERIIVVSFTGTTSVLLEPSLGCRFRKLSLVQGWCSFVELNADRSGRFARLPHIVPKILSPLIEFPAISPVMIPSKQG